MRFMIGYQMLPDDALLDLVLARREKVAEIYFAWPGLASGRGSAGRGDSLLTSELQNKLIADLQRLSRGGIACNLLLNGHCYGRESLARTFFEEIGGVIDFLHAKIFLSSITTSSPVIAKFLKQNFPELERRASVNMEIGSREGMDYLAEYFDGYYLRREWNRNRRKIEEMRAWCRRNRKKLYALANSGCLNECSAHNFHDNLVAHEDEIRAMDNAYDFRGICREWLSRKEKREHFLEVGNFIRPEDVHLYEGCFDAVKLATRINPDPVKVATAYLDETYSGNLPDLLEPDHADLFHPDILENKLLPEDFGEHVLNCGHDCPNCCYCREAFAGARVDVEAWSRKHAAMPKTGMTAFPGRD